MTAVQVSDTTHAHMLLVSVAFFGGAFGGMVHWMFTSLFWTYMRMSGNSSECSGLFSQEVYTMALWGLLFCFPLHRHMANFWLRALAFAVVPTLYALFFAIPASYPNAGFLGLGISWFTPAFTLVSYSLTWSVPAYLWVGFCGYGGTVHTSLDDPTVVEGDTMVMSAVAPDDQTLLP